MNEYSKTIRILEANPYLNGYQLLRIAAPDCAMAIQPGQFIRANGRPLAVMRASPTQGWVECLCRGFEQLSFDQEVEVNCPLGMAFKPDTATPRALLLGNDTGLAPLIFLVDALRNRRPRVKPLLLLAAERPLPFRPQPSRIIVPGLPAWVIAAIPLLEDWGVPSRLACSQDWPGCFNGSLEALARCWLDSLQGTADVTVFACGSEDLLVSTRQLAADYRLSYQAVAEACQI